MHRAGAGPGQVRGRLPHLAAATAGLLTLLLHCSVGLRRGARRVKERAQKLIKGAKKYSQGIEGAYAATQAFADSLEAFCEGTDEESMLLGAL